MMIGYVLLIEKSKRWKDLPLKAINDLIKKKKLDEEHSDLRFTFSSTIGHKIDNLMMINKFYLFT